MDGRHFCRPSGHVSALSVTPAIGLAARLSLVQALGSVQAVRLTAQADKELPAEHGIAPKPAQPTHQDYPRLPVPAGSHGAPHLPSPVSGQRRGCPQQPPSRAKRDLCADRWSGWNRYVLPCVVACVFADGCTDPHDRRLACGARRTPPYPTKLAPPLPDKSGCRHIGRYPRALAQQRPAPWRVLQAEI